MAQRIRDMKELIKTVRIVFLCVIPVMLLGAGVTSCQTVRSLDVIPYRVARNYFLRNDVALPLNPLITTQTQFQQTVGMATTMGAAGRPTPIDFDTSFVIAVAIPPLQQDCTLEVVSVQCVAEGEMRVVIRKTLGEPFSFAIQPCLFLMIDRAYLPRKVEVCFVADTL